MILAYILTMPNAGSWNGKWTGEGGCYCIVRKYPKDSERCANAQKQNYHYYINGSTEF